MRQVRRVVRCHCWTVRPGHRVDVRRLSGPWAVTAHLIQAARAAPPRAAPAAAAVGSHHPLARLLLAAAAMAAAAAWDAGHRVTDLHPPRRHHERAPRA
jgi:hypothetical protein